MIEVALILYALLAAIAAVTISAVAVCVKCRYIIEASLLSCLVFMEGGGMYWLVFYGQS